MASTIESLVANVKELPESTQRRISALLGATVADVATRPLHWVYNQKVLDDVIGNSKEPEFWPESKCPFFTIPPGIPSCYNDIALVSLSSLNENDGKLNIKHLCESLKTHFGAGSNYSDALARRPTDKSKLPMEGPWMHRSLIHFLDIYEGGQMENIGAADNKEFDGFCAALPLVALYAGKDNMWTEVAKVTSILSNMGSTNEMFHTAALLISNHVTGNSDALESVKEIIQPLYPDVYELVREVEEAKNLPFISTVEKFGKACYLPGSFQGGLLAMLQTTSYVDAVRLNITGGGCNGGRSNFIGACYGAKCGIDGIPIDWLKKVKDIEKITEMAIKVLSSA